MRRPAFAIVGAPKAGTTALYSWLVRHPDLYLPPEKELHFFDQRRDEGSAWYLAQFEPAGSRLAGDATPTYLGHPTAIEELATLNPAIRIIVVVREPVARAWSHYHYGRSRSWYTDSFEAMVIREVAALAHGVEEPGGLVHEGRYGHHLERAARHVARAQLLVLRQDDLLRSPADVLERVTRFLGVRSPVVDQPLDEIVNRTHHVRLPRLHAAMLRTRADRLLAPTLRRWVERALASPGYPELDARVAAAVRTVYDEDQAVLASFLAASAGEC